MTIHQTKKYSTWALRGDVDTDWYESYANRSIFELGDAASILANVQPEYPGKLDAACLAEISQWVETLKASVHELLAQSGYNEKEPLHHRLSHKKLRAWCSESDFFWPIPENAAERIRTLELQLEDERKLRLRDLQLADPFSPPILQLDEPEEVYRHMEYLTESQSQDWMGRISGQQVPFHTLIAMAEFKIFKAFMDCRAMKGVTHPLNGEHEHRTVYGLGVCQVMNPFQGKGAPAYLSGPAIHVDIHGYQEIETNCSWWIDYPESYELLFRPTDIEIAGRMLNADGGWSSESRHADIESDSVNEPGEQYCGSELAQLLGNLKVSVDNQHDQLLYRVRFKDGRLLAELGADLVPLSAAASATSLEQFDGAMRERCNNEGIQADKNELARLREVVAEQSVLLEKLQKDNNPDIGAPGPGITFPYSTRELEVMRAVATEYWAGLDPRHRQPKQEFIQEEIRKMLGMNLGKNDAMPNKAVYLATAIRPDGAPRA